MFEVISLVLLVVCAVLIAKKSPKKNEDLFEQFMLQDLNSFQPPTESNKVSVYYHETSGTTLIQ